MDPTRRGFLATAATTVEQRRPAACKAEPQTTKEAHEFFDRPTCHGIRSRLRHWLSGADRKRRSDEGVTTRFLRFGSRFRQRRSGHARFLEEIYIVSGTFEVEGGRTRKAV